jgi:anti-sigma-K factor RskA
MRWRRERPDVHTLVGAYVLDSVDDAERTAVERHLKACPGCAGEVAELQTTASNLSFPALAQPGPQLRARLLAEVRETRQLPPIPQPQADVEPWRLPARFRQPRLIALAAALVIFVVMLSFVGFNQHRGDRPNRDNVASAVLAARDATTRNTSYAESGSVTVISSRTRNAGVVVLSKLPEPPVNLRYQLWLMHNGKARSAGVVPRGATMRLLTKVDDSTQVAMTLEPAAGSSQPTMNPLVQLDL